MKKQYKTPFLEVLSVASQAIIAASAADPSKGIVVSDEDAREGESFVKTYHYSIFDEKQ